MKKLRVRCDECGHLFRLSPELSGRKIRCLHCSALMDAPESQTSTDRRDLEELAVSRKAAADTRRSRQATAPPEWPCSLFETP